MPTGYDDPLHFFLIYIYTLYVYAYLFSTVHQFALRNFYEKS